MSCSSKNNEELSINWKKAEIVTKIISITLVPIIIIVISYMFSSTIDKAKIDAVYVGIGVDILKADPSEKNIALRRWAADVVSKKSFVKMEAPIVHSLIKDIPWPSRKQWERLPNSAFSYQEKDGRKLANKQFLVHCHWSKDRCDYTKGNNFKTMQTSCKLVDLRIAKWNPLPGGYYGAWYAFASQEFGYPFPTCK